MRDLLFLTLTLTFFTVAAGVVRLCDRIVGPDPLERAPLPEHEPVA
jgi:hypothetical protein